MPEFLFDGFLVDVLRSGIRLGTPIILAAIGAALCHRAGVLNFALEGMMLFGAFFAIVTAFWVGSTEAGVLLATIGGGLIGGLIALLHLRWRVDIVILALAINLFIAEMTVFFLRIFFGAFGSWSDPSIRQLTDIEIPGISALPLLGPLLSGHNMLIYLSWVIALGAWLLLFRMRFGRHLRAVGENQAAAESVGISAVRAKLFVLVLSGCLAGLAGAFLSVGHLTLFTRDMSNGRGWLGVTAALFGLNNPVFVFLAGLFFGVADALAVRLPTITDIPPSLIQFLPNVSALLALILVGLRGPIRSRIAARRRRIPRDAEPGMEGLPDTDPPTHP
ncbi:MAG: ABC transporter permease [Candidatus Limnocylindria bacterium]